KLVVWVTHSNHPGLGKSLWRCGIGTRCLTLVVKRLGAAAAVWTASSTSPLSEQHYLVLQQLRRPRGLPKYAEVVQDIIICGLDCGLRATAGRRSTPLTRGFLAYRFLSPDLRWLMDSKGGDALDDPEHCYTADGVCRNKL